MTAAQASSQRTVIPRWRSWRTTEQARELTPLHVVDREVTEANQESLRVHAEDFKSSPGLHIACDLINTAVVLGLQDDHAVAAAGFVLEHPSASEAARAVAEHLLNPEKSRPGPESVVQNASDTLYRGSITHLKSIVVHEPRNAIRWVDLARCYTALGAKSAAERAMRIALAAGKPNRFVLRAAARFEIHRNHFDQAAHILNRDPGRLEDPWVLAAEIATSTLNETTSRHMKLARKILERQQIAPRHLSELASAVATVELNNGKEKPARKLMAMALKNPTDNSLAQGEWFEGKGIELMANEEDLLNIPLSFEARANYASRNEDWSEAIQNGMLWLADQPFSYDAAAFTSYAACLGGEDFATGAAAAKAGLVTNPGHPMLKNNLAFALLNLERIDDARLVLHSIRLADLDRDELAIVTATRGLMEYRHGRIEAGRRLYTDAIEIFVRLGYRTEAAKASVLSAREELRAQTNHAHAAVSEAERRAAVGGAEARSFFARILSKSKAIWAS